jgi:hypothetical protein
MAILFYQHINHHRFRRLGNADQGAVIAQQAQAMKARLLRDNPNYCRGLYWVVFSQPPKRSL